MSTLAGTPDYNTSPLQDTRILVSQTYNLVSAAQQTIGPFYVQQNGHLFVNASPSSLPACRLIIYFDFYADAALTKLIDTRSYVFTNNNPFKQMVPILGAYVIVRAQSNDAGGNSTTITVSVDSRSDALGLFNRGRELASPIPYSLAAGAAQTVDMLPTVGGPGLLYWEYTGTNYGLSIWTQDFGGNNRFLFHINQANAPTSRWTNLVWPAGQMQLSLSNGDTVTQSFHIVAIMA